MHCLLLDHMQHKLSLRGAACLPFMRFLSLRVRKTHLVNFRQLFLCPGPQCSCEIRARRWRLPHLTVMSVLPASCTSTFPTSSLNPSHHPVTHRLPPRVQPPKRSLYRVQRSLAEERAVIIGLKNLTSFLPPLSPSLSPLKKDI